MSSWIGWLSRPSKKAQAESAHTLSLTKLETETRSATEAAASSTNSPSKPRLYPPLDSTASTPSAPLLSDAIRDDWMNEAANKTNAANTTNNNSSTTPGNEKQLSEKELGRIKEENERLKNVLQQIQRKPASSSSSSSPLSSYNFQHVGHIPGGNGFLLSIPSLSTPAAVATPTTPAAAVTPPSSAAAAPASLSTLALSTSNVKEKPKEKKENDALVCHGEHSTVLVKQVKDENENENAVALLDLNEVDWWVMVNGTETPDKATPKGRSSKSSTSVEVDDDDCVHREAGMRIVKSHLTYDDEGYVLIDENDFIQALSDFISQSIARQYPEAERIPPQELQKVLKQAFLPIKQPSTLGKAYQWAQFLYQSYSWGSCAWSLYREPFYVKLVLRGAMKAAQWLLVLVI